MTQLNVKLLGRLTCELPGGQQLNLSTRKSEALLAYLAMSPGLHHSRERLVNLFWSDRGEDQARNSLRQALSSLKKVLDAELPELLEIERTTVRLKADKISVDVDVFRLLVSESDIDKLVEAADVYSGEFLEGMVIRDPAGEQWLAEERDNLKRAYVDVLGRLSQLQLDNSDYRSAINSAERLVSIDPLEESGWRLLMNANHRNGNRNHALMAYKRCCDVLQKELGVEPEAETRGLQEQIKAGNSGASSPDFNATAKAASIPSSDSIPLSDSGTGENSILVLPLQNLSNDPQQQYFSDGLTDSIITGLSRFPSLRIHSRNSSFAAREHNLTTRQIGEQFGARYVVEGSLRRSEQRIRISAQLVNVESGKQIWGEQFDNRLEDTFELEDRITRAIVSTVKGKIDAADEKIALLKPAKDIESYDLMLRGFHQVMKNNPSDNQAGIELLKQYLEIDDNNDLAHLHIYHGYLINWISCWHEPRSEFFENAGIHVRKALELNPENAFNQACMSEYQMFRQEWQLAESHADMAIRLNPNDPESLATVCAVYAALGDIDKALEHADTCLLHDPFHPWINWVAGDAYYSARKYREALNAFQNIPNPADEISGWTAACYQRLGDHENAIKYLKQYLELTKKHMARFPQTLEEWKSIWHSSAVYRYPENVDHPFNALCDAGLGELFEASEKPEIEETHSIAVLPFDNLSGDPEQEYFSDGITESIILNLSLFPDLNVKSRNSSFAFKEQMKSLGEISKELNVDYVVEGSIRKVNDRIRVTVQLIEAESGNQIWGKRQDSDLSNLFDLEEELSRTIAATVTGQIESDLQRIAISKSAVDQQSYDLLLSGKYHCYKFTREDMIVSQEKLEACLALDPTNVQAHALLYECHIVNWMERWIVDYEHAFKLAGDYIHKALKLDPEVVMVQIFFAEYLIFCRENEAAARCVEKVLSINPNNPDALATKAFNLNAIGEYELALETSKNCKQLDLCNPWVDWIIAEAQLFTGDPSEAIQTILNSKTSISYLKALLVVAYSQTGNEARAKETMQQFLQLCRDTMLSMPANRDEWINYWSDNLPYRDTRMVDDLIACLMEAGLCDETEIRKNNSNTDDHPVIAVLPFDNLSNDPEQEYFSDGITDSIILNLTSFPDLNVKSRNASFAFKQQIKSLGEISEELKVDYLVEGSIRKSADQVRINVQLIEAASSNQVWGKRYDAVIENLFDLEADLSRTIAATVTGQIESDLQRIAIAKRANSQDAYDLLLSGLYHSEKVTRQDMVIAIDKLTSCIELEPGNIRALVGLYQCHILNYLEGWVAATDDNFKLVEKYIQNALTIDSENTSVLAAYGEYLIFAREPEKALWYLEKALQKNPNEIEAISSKGFALTMLGNHEKGLECADLAFHLDPYNPWVSWNLSECQILLSRYEDALETIAESVNEPTLLKVYSVVANVKSGRIDVARVILSELLEACQESMLAMPSSPKEWFSYINTYIPYKDDSFSDTIVDCMRQAGLEDAMSKFLPVETTDEMPSVLVLPFENMSGDPDQNYFSDGITESIILALSASKDLQVKSRHTSFAYKQSPLSINAIGEELDIQYIVEGSIRKYGDQVRITVQLGEVSSGNQIWGKRYDSPLEQLFELEEDLVHTIVGTISGLIGHEIKVSSIHKSKRNLKSFDYLARGNYHVEKLTAAEVAVAKDMFQKCLKIDPTNSDAHTGLAIAIFVELFEGWAVDRQASKEVAHQHIQTALELEPDNALTHAYLSEFQLFTRDFELGIYHADRSIELGPHIPDGYAIKGYLLAITGKQQEALELADISMRIDPYHYYMGWNAGEAYRICGQYQKALETFRSIPHPPAGLYAEIAACLIGLGQIDRAKVEMQAFQSLAREQMAVYPESKKGWYQHWYEVVPYDREEDFDVFFNQLLQAGLCDGGDNKLDDMPSLAVLPFENMSGDPEQDFFSDGLTTDVVSILSRFPRIRTVARHSTLQYRDQKTSIADIAEQQNVRYILEGSVRKSGDRIRVNADLIDASNGESRWSERYDRALDDIFSVQDDITKNLAAAMKVHFEDGDRTLQRAGGTKNIKAWELVLRASDLQDSYIHQNILESRSLLNQALDIDPNYCFAWVSLGWSHWQEAYTGWCESFEDSMSQAEIAVEKALNLEPDNGDAWGLKANNYLMKNQGGNGIEALKKAVELEPGNAEIQMLMAYAYCQVEEFEFASEHYRIAMKLCPICPNWYFLVGGEIEQNIGSWDEAIRLARRAIEVEPESPLGRFYLIDALLEQGDEAGAIQLAEEIRALDKSINGKGMVRICSQNPARRKSFQKNLIKMGFEA